MRAQFCSSQKAGRTFLHIFLLFLPQTIFIYSTRGLTYAVFRTKKNQYPDRNVRREKFVLQCLEALPIKGKTVIYTHPEATEFFFEATPDHLRRRKS